MGIFINTMSIDNLFWHKRYYSYFQDVLASTKLSYDDNEIQLHKDGSWSTHLKQSDSSDNSAGKTVQKVEVISDDIGIFLNAIKLLNITIDLIIFLYFSQN